MKKLLVALLSLGLIVAFSMSASAATVKFSGQYYVNGIYEDNRPFGDGAKAYSRAFMFNRTRVQMVFDVAKGLSFTTRFDAFEKQWGAVNRSSGTAEDKSNSGKIKDGIALQENLEMEHGYVTFMTRIGKFDIGYQAADEWGTRFADTPGSRPRAKYTGAFGPLNVIAIYQKNYEADTVMYTSTPSGVTDGDADRYMLAGIFNWKGGNAGLLYVYGLTKNAKPTAHYYAETNTLAPFFKATFGPVYMEGEVVYTFGKARKYDTGKGTDIDLDSLGAYLMARVNMGPMFFGGQVGYSAGDDGSDPTKSKTGPASSTSWTPALIFGNANLRVWAYGSHHGTGTAHGAYSTDKQNLILYNVFGGFKVTPKFTVEAAFSFMQADKTPAGYISKDYGYEADIKATYRIYDNLTYMLGAGYLWTGDYFKGKSADHKVGNDYLFMHQLTLSF
ncbi:MAG: hypothetical protein AB1558_10640 [Thermodesulfobacteriota bacterium]